MANKESLLKALDDKTRRQILEMLKNESRLSAGEIANHFGLTNATMSHHLSILSNANLVKSEKQGKYIYYMINTTVLHDLLSWIMDLVKPIEEYEESSVEEINI